MNTLRILLSAAMLTLFSGCVSKTPEKEYAAPPLMIAQNGDGDVTIAWESHPDYLYTVFYQSTSTADWKGLPKAHRVSGTGQTLTVYDRVNPNRPPRRYRILPEKK